MKMGDRTSKKLDGHGVRVVNKPRLTTEPTNRQERRALARAVRKAEKHGSQT